MGGGGRTEISNRMAMRSFGILVVDTWILNKAELRSRVQLRKRVSMTEPQSDSKHSVNYDLINKEAANEFCNNFQYLAT